MRSERMLVHQPGAPELRMLCAIAQQAIGDALHNGVDHASFGGYRIEARRMHGGCGGYPLIELTLSAIGSAGFLDRVFIEVALRPRCGSACGICFSGAYVDTSRPTGSLVGCVSPFDARHASPETGQIS
jgi:hypothetical protein